MISHPGIKIAEIISGSHRYGLATEKSDLDVRGIFMESGHIAATRQFGSGYRDFIASSVEDCWMEEIEKFCFECLKCNPERLELIFTDPKSEFVKYSHPLWTEVYNMRHSFLERHRVIAAYSGFANAEHQKTCKQNNHKSAATMIRLLMNLEQLIETGNLDPDMSKHRDYLLSIKNGEVKMGKIIEKYLDMSMRLSEYKNKEWALPEKSDKHLIADFISSVRWHNWR